MLQKGAYNPSLIRFHNRLLLSYRVHDRNNDWRTSLHIAELSDALSPIASKPFVPPNEHKDNSLEDCRLFSHAGKLHASFTISQWPATVFRSIVGFGELLETANSWQISKCIIPAYGKNNFTGIEKNHIFFTSGKTLYCLYLTDDKEQTILRIEGDKVSEVIKSKALSWPYAQAQIHGGAICEGENGNLLHFFNSHTTHRDRSLDRYLVGVAELSGASPFAMVRISSCPLLVVEEGACLDKNPYFKSNVMFVCGAIKDGDSWLVSHGWNDCQCRIARLRVDDLRL